jgi:hypothetical protein
MNQVTLPSTLYPPLPGDYRLSPAIETLVTLGEKYPRMFVRASAVISGFLSGLIIFFIAIDLGGYRGAIPLALAYSFAYMLAAYWTLRMSRVAAISALLLYALMHHSNCGFLHMAVHLGICVGYIAGIAGTILVNQKRRNCRLR